MCPRFHFNPVWRVVLGRRDPHGSPRAPEVPGVQDPAGQLRSRGAGRAQRQGDRGGVAQEAVHERDGARFRGTRENNK